MRMKRTKEFIGAEQRLLFVRDVQLQEANQMQDLKPGRRCASFVPARCHRLALTQISYVKHSTKANLLRVDQLAAVCSREEYLYLYIELEYMRINYGYTISVYHRAGRRGNGRIRTRGEWVVDQEANAEDAPRNSSGRKRARGRRELRAGQRRHLRVERRRRRRARVRREREHQRELAANGERDSSAIYADLCEHTCSVRQYEYTCVHHSCQKLLKAHRRENVAFGEEAASGSTGNG